MVYTATDDPACYPGTDVLRNKANIQDADLLAEFELTMSVTRSDEGFPKGKLDYKHYCALHEYLFQDVYDWAGKVRNVRTGKSGHWFCYPEHIDQEMSKIFTELATDNWLVGLSKDEFIIKTAHFLAEVNAVHPFREGNGRTQIAFIVLLTDNAGFSFDGEKLNPETMLSAMVDSFKGDEKSLIGLLEILIS